MEEDSELLVINDASMDCLGHVLMVVRQGKLCSVLLNLAQERGLGQ